MALPQEQIVDISNRDAPSKPRDYADSLTLGIGMMLALMIVQRGIGFLRNLLFCRYLEPNELGLWNLAFSALILLAPFLVFGIPGVFGRYVEYYRQRGQLVSFLRRSLLITFALMLLGVGTLFVASRQASWLVFGDYSQIQLTTVMVVGLGFVIAFNAMIELCTALRQVRLLSYLQFTNGILFASFAMALICVYEPSAVSVMIGYAAACLVTSLVAAVPLWQILADFSDDAEPVSQRRYWAKIVPFASSLWLINLFANSFAAADRYMIVHFCSAGPTAAAGLVGQYHSSLMIPQLVVSVGIMLGSIILPYLSHDWERGNRAAVGERINKIMRLFGVGATAVGALALWFAPWLFSWALADKYTLGLTVMPMTMVYCIWYGIFNIQQDYLFCLERAGQVGVAMFIGLATNIVLNYFLLPLYGLHGAVIATSMANASALGYGLFWSRRRGMTLHRSTIAVLLLPLCLNLGALPAAIAVLVFLWVGIRYHWIITAEELQATIDKASAVLERYILRRKPSRVA